MSHSLNQRRAGKNKRRDAIKFLPPASQMYGWLGIDGGASGELAVRFSDGRWAFHRPRTCYEQGRRELDIQGNLETLHLIARESGGTDRLMVTYEGFRKQPKWGTKNIFTTGRYDEFWRVVLSLGKFHFWRVDPRTWQTWAFRDIPKMKPKPRARKFIEAACPEVKLDGYSQAEQLGIVDAMCVSLWSREFYNDIIQMAWGDQADS